MFGLNPWVLLAAGIAFVGACVASFHFGTSYEAGQQARAQQELRVQLQAEKDAKQAAVQQAKDEAAMKIVDLELELLRAQGKVRVVTETITKEVPVHVTEKADRACVVPVGFVSLWNRSVGDPAGGDSTPTPEASVVLDAPSGVALSAVAEAAVANHGAYWGVVAEVKARDAYIAALLDYINNLRKANQ